jgi:hypothetical protein
MTQQNIVYSQKINMLIHCLNHPVYQQAWDPIHDLHLLKTQSGLSAPRLKA